MKNPKREDGKQPQEKKRPSGAQQRKLRGVRKTRRLRKTRNVRKKANKLAGMRGTQHRPSQDQRSKMREWEATTGEENTFRCTAAETEVCAQNKAFA